MDNRRRKLHSKGKTLAQQIPRVTAISQAPSATSCGVKNQTFSGLADADKTAFEVSHFQLTKKNKHYFNFSKNAMWSGHVSLPVLASGIGKDAKNNNIFVYSSTTQV
eukprot:GHVS01103134.1.p3 GENE.GHVS01103134.1~~GHVS01103134.1.p3  ORF type:complete len:107 (+),score=7.92 GHVS01103134.1:491-811(+)